MLSRIANNLFWMARYLERAEHMARFINVNYFSSLDAPVTISKPFILASIQRMNGQLVDNQTEEEILYQITFDRKNPNSIISSVTFARENARSSRDIISTELWEAINKYYHFVISYNIDAFKKTHLFDFLQQVNSMNMVIKGRIDSTLIHNNVWDIIKVGLHVERAVQVIRALQTKFEDIKELDRNDRSIAVNSHQLATLLRGLESFDMSRKHYKKAPTIENSVEFLFLNPDFPRSYLFCLQRINLHLNRISPAKFAARNSAEYLASKNLCKLQYTSIEEVLEDFEEKLNLYLGLTNDLARKIETQYLI